MSSNKYEYCGMKAYEGCQVIYELAGAILILRGIDSSGVNPVLNRIVSNKSDLAIYFVLKWLVNEMAKKGIDVQGKEFCQIVNCASQESCQQRKGKRFSGIKPPGITLRNNGIFGPVSFSRQITNGSKLPT